MRIKEMLPICCQYLTEFVWNPHKYCLLFGRFLIRTLSCGVSHLTHVFKYFDWRILNFLIILLRWAVRLFVVKTLSSTYYQTCIHKVCGSRWPLFHCSLNCSPFGIMVTALYLNSLFETLSLPRNSRSVGNKFIRFDYNCTKLSHKLLIANFPELYR